LNLAHGLDHNHAKATQESERLPLGIDLDAAIEWLKLRCVRAPCPETWGVYYGPDRRVTRHERFTGPRSSFPYEKAGESFVIVSLEGPPSGEPIELQAIHGLIHFVRLQASLEGPARQGPEDHWVIDHAGHAWNVGRAMEAYKRRRNQCTEAHGGNQLEPEAEMDWIVETILRETQS
jgi:hypothetical protein